MTDENDNRPIDKEKFEQFIEAEYGLTKEDLQWLSAYHHTTSKYGDWVAKAIVSSLAMSIVAGIGYVLWLGVVQAARMLGKG